MTRHRLSLSERYRSLSAAQRLGVVGSLVAIGSLALPWYGLTISGGIGKSGFSAFSWVEAAMLLTLGAALLLVYEISKGRALPIPLHEGTLLTVCGAWTAALIVYRMFDRPHFKLGDFHQSYDLRYGIFIALAGAVLIVISGMRRRQAEVAQERRNR